MRASAIDALGPLPGRGADGQHTKGKRSIDPDLSAAFPRARLVAGRPSVDPPRALAPAAIDPVIPLEAFAGAAAKTGAALRARSQRRDADHAERQDRSRRRGRSAPAGTLQRGAILDKYRIEGLLGMGGFAVVYRATHLLMQRQVALKLIRPDVLERHPESATHLIEEARLLARINHPNVVGVYDLVHGDSMTYVVMEYVDGGTLSSMIETHGRMSTRRVLRVALDVAQGLDAGLEQGLIHRDVKPANILMSNRGAARLVDFGLAHRNFVDFDSQRSDASKTVIGTRGYMAPEQALNPDRVTFRADIYALGATLYEAAMGTPLRPRDRYGESGRNSVVRDTTEAVRRAPVELRRLLAWMLATKPEARPSSYRALVAELEATLHRSPRAR